MEREIAETQPAARVVRVQGPQCLLHTLINITRCNATTDGVVLPDEALKRAAKLMQSSSATKGSIQHMNAAAQLEQPDFIRHADLPTALADIANPNPHRPVLGNIVEKRPKQQHQIILSSTSSATTPKTSVFASSIPASHKSPSPHADQTSFPVRASSHGKGKSLFARQFDAQQIHVAMLDGRPDVPQLVPAASTSFKFSVKRSATAADAVSTAVVAESDKDRQSIHTSSLTKLASSFRMR